MNALVRFENVKKTYRMGENGAEPIPYPKKDQCAINSNLAENMDINVGDQISLYDNDMNELKATVTALCDNYVYNYIYNRGNHGISMAPYGGEFRLCHRYNRF